MSVLKEWKCAAHGTFEGTHPICPHLGCRSQKVERVFLTPVGISKGQYKRFDQGLRRTSERMDISDFRTVKEGETAFAGRAPIGQELLWGSDVAKVMGRPFAEQMQAAQAPLQLPTVKPEDPHLRVNNAMRTLTNDSPATMQRRIPQAEVTTHRQDVPKSIPV